MKNIKAVFTTNLILWLSYSVGAAAVELRRSPTQPPTTFATVEHGSTLVNAAANHVSQTQGTPRRDITHWVLLRLITSDLRSNHRKTLATLTACSGWLDVNAAKLTGRCYIFFVTTCFNPNQRFKQLLRSAARPNSTGFLWNFAKKRGFMCISIHCCCANNWSRFIHGSIWWHMCFLQSDVITPPKKKRALTFSHGLRVACAVLVRRCVEVICFSGVKRDVKSRLK